MSRIKASEEDGMTGASDKLTNREKLIYQTTTGIVCAVMVFSIINFIFNDHFLS